MVYALHCDVHDLTGRETDKSVIKSLAELTRILGYSFMLLLQVRLPGTLSRQAPSYATSRGLFSMGFGLGRAFVASCNADVLKNRGSVEYLHVFAIQATPLALAGRLGVPKVFMSP